MSKLADKVVEKLFADWKGKPVPRLIQDGTNGAGWGKEVVRAIIEEAEQGVEPTVITCDDCEEPAVVHRCREHLE